MYKVLSVMFNAFIYLCYYYTEYYSKPAVMHVSAALLWIVNTRPHSMREKKKILYFRKIHILMIIFINTGNTLNKSSLINY